MKKLLLIALAVFISSCSKSDENDGTPNFFCRYEMGIGTRKGYEISGEYKDEWNAKSDDFDAVYVFRKDNTGDDLRIYQWKYGEFYIRNQMGTQFDGCGFGYQLY